RFMVEHGFVFMDFPRTVSLAAFRASRRRGDRALQRLQHLANRIAQNLQGASQLIHADAIYLRDMESLLDLAVKSGQGLTPIAKTVATCCVLNHFEYASRITTAALGGGLIDKTDYTDLLKTIRAISRSPSSLTERAGGAV